jgi:hypothetical protein
MFPPRYPLPTAESMATEMRIDRQLDRYPEAQRAALVARFTSMQFESGSDTALLECDRDNVPCSALRALGQTAGFEVSERKTVGDHALLEFSLLPAWSALEERTKAIEDARYKREADKVAAEKSAKVAANAQRAAERQKREEYEHDSRYM